MRRVAVDVPLSLDDFVDLPQILISFSGREGIVDTALRAVGRKRRIHTALTHFSGVAAYLGQMCAVATLPSHAAYALARDSGLDLSPPPMAMGDYAVTTSCRRDLAADPAIVWFRQQVAGVLRSSALR
jgi:DNA-binding transcriptional LysR family regulator